MAHPARPFPDVLEEHWDDLDFLCEQRVDILSDSDYSLRDLAEHEERIEAHLDGVRIAGEAGLNQARDVLAEGDSEGAVAAAVRLLSEHSTEDERLVEALRDGPAFFVAAGLRHATPGDIQRLAPAIHSAASDAPLAPARGAAREVLAFHRKQTPQRDDSDLAGGDSEVRQSYWRAERRLNALTAGHVTSAFSEVDFAVRSEAFRALAHCAVPGFLDELRRAAAQDDALALEWLGILRSRADESLVVSAVERTRPQVGIDRTEEDLALRSSALRGLGALGSVTALAALAGAAGDDDVREVALDSWSRITGLEVDPETTSEEQMTGLAQAWTKDLDDEALYQGGRPFTEGEWNGLDYPSMRSRRDLYAAARLAGSPDDVEIEALARRQ